MSRHTIERLYGAFAQLDGAGMQACYAPGATFQDEVFTLHGAHEVGGMWRMLCDTTRSQPANRAAWRLMTRNVKEQAGQGSAHWRADYVFTATGNRVRNRVDAAFTFDANGLILTHRDRFSFWTWARQALGLPGLLLGWTPLLRGKVRRQAAANLQRYLSNSTASEPARSAASLAEPSTSTIKT